MLIIIVPVMREESNKAYIGELLGSIKAPLDQYVSSYDVVASVEEY